MRKFGSDIWGLDTSHHVWRCKGFDYNLRKNNYENWEKVSSPSLFSNIEASRTCVWAVDFDHYIHLYVKTCDSKIGFQEYCFEYEKGYFGGKWKKMHKEESSTARQLSKHWTKDSVWRIDRNVSGTTTDPDGWQYAAGVNSTFTDTNSASCFVRRRRLARYNTYNKMGKFAQLEDSPTTKFLDVAAGGNLLPRSNDWAICVWAISKDCSVYFREGISSINPEGDRWVEVCMPDFRVSRIAVGSRGQLWCITTAGEIVTRLGVDNDNLMGTSWAQVNVRVERLESIYPVWISVTANSVWMVDSRNRAFFHRGAEVFEVNNKLVVDRYKHDRVSKWLHMVQDDKDIIQFKCITTGVEHQVWALDTDNRLYNRTEVSSEQLAGQQWQLVEDPNTKAARRENTESEEEEEMFPKSVPSVSAFGGTMRTMGGARTLPMVIPGSSAPNACHPVILPEPVRPQPDNEGAVYDFDEPDDLFGSDLGMSENASIDTTDLENIVQGENDGVHFWNYLSAGGCQGVGITQTDMLSRQAELTKPQLANIKRCRTVIIERLRDLNSETRHRKYDSFYEVNEDAGCRLRTNARLEYTPGVWHSTTIYLSMNIPHGNLRFSIFRQGNRASLNDTDGSGGRLHVRQNRNYLEPTVILQCTSNMEEVIVVPLIDLRGIKRISPNIKEHTLVLLTKDKNYRIYFNRDTDSTNWFDRINDYVKAIHEVPDVPPNQSVWALASYGMIYFSPPAPSCLTSHGNRVWIPIEGNFDQISAGPRSIVWGVTPDNDVYCFTRGYGGGNHAMGENLETFSVRRHFRVTENQRYSILRRKFCPCSDNDRMDRYVDEGNHPLISIEQYHLPHAAWRWTGEWCPETSDKTDPEGWTYAKNFHSRFSPSTVYGARKRVHLREATMLCNVPWKQIPVQMIKVTRVALEHYCFKGMGDYVAAWALCTNGNLLYRDGVTPANPMGEKWVDVTSDHKLVDIALDAYTNLWAICNDGSAYFRMGITLDNPTGSRWMHIIKPENGANLVRIAAGKYNVWVISDTGICYIRSKISVNKEFGVGWEKVNSIPMSAISINCSDQVFGVRDSDKAVVSRVGVTGENLKGTDWDLVLDNYWKDVCVTATSQEHHWDEVDEHMMNNMSRYRTTIWVRLREYNEKLKRGSEEHVEYDRVFQQLGPGSAVIVRDTSSNMWSANTISRVGPDNHLKTEKRGIFSTTYETVLPRDVASDTPPHHTHICPGTEVLAKLSSFSDKYTRTTVLRCVYADSRGWVYPDTQKKVVVEGNTTVAVSELRIPPVILQADIYFLDRRRSTSFFMDDKGHELVIC